MARQTAEQFLETMSVLSWFRSHPEASIMKASRELQLSVPQIRHDLTQLSLCGLPGHLPGTLVEVTVDKTTAQVEYAAGLDGMIGLSELEAGVLLLSLEALTSVMPESDHPALASAGRKIHSMLDHVKRSEDSEVSEDSADKASDRLHASADEGDSMAVASENGPIDLLRKAITERRIVRGEYLTLGRDVRESRTLIPDHLALINGKMYLWAREREDAEQKSFAVDRLTGIHLEAPGSAPAAIVPVIRDDDPFELAETETWAQLTLKEDARWMLEYFPMYWENADSAGPVRVDIPNTGPWLERFIVANSSSIAQVEPLGLAKALRHRAEESLAVYERIHGGVS